MPTGSRRVSPVVPEHVIQVCDTKKEPGLCTPELLCNVSQRAVSRVEWVSYFKSELLVWGKAVIRMP